MSYVAIKSKVEYYNLSWWKSNSYISRGISSINFFLIRIDCNTLYLLLNYYMKQEETLEKKN